MSDLQRAFDALAGKLPVYNSLFQYAAGTQPLVYSTDRLRSAFGNINARFSQNWLAVVLDSELDRMALTGLDVEDKAANTALDAVYSEQMIGADAHEAHRAALITGESFVIVWPAEDTGEPEIYYNDPRLCHVFYKADKPKVKEFACKWWVDAGGYHLTLYYPDRLEYYISPKSDTPTSYNAFQPAQVPQAPNPYDTIPVFHLRTSPREARSVLSDVLTLQDAVNKLLADMMVAAEYGAFPQRYVIAHSDTTSLKNGPNMVWEIPANDGQGENTQVGQFAATQLENYFGSIDKLANSIAIISRTPKHFFYNTGAALSGEALMAMEAPLTKKTEQHMALFGGTWREIGAFLLRLMSMGDYKPVDVVPVWKPPQSIQPYTQAQTRQLSTAAGIPLETVLKRDEGWTDADIQAMDKDRQAEQKRNAAIAPVLLAEARMNQDNSNDDQNDEGDNDNGLSR